LNIILLQLNQIIIENDLSESRQKLYRIPVKVNLFQKTERILKNYLFSKYIFKKNRFLKSLTILPRVALYLQNFFKLYLISKNLLNPRQMEIRIKRIS
jgi:hypothetical protein